MIVVCSDCKKLIKVKKPLSDTRKSHSLCTKCAKKQLDLFKEIEEDSL